MSIRLVTLGFEYSTAWLATRNIFDEKEELNVSSAEEVPNDGVLVLYVVGHGTPNNLVGSDGKLISEQSLANRIRVRRENLPTLIVWDLCYAKSFFRILGDKTGWSGNYGHIFSCQEYERTWHSGGPERQTTFSKYLRESLDELRLQIGWSWSDLQDKLRAKCGTVQTPEIVSGLVPSVFFD